MATPTEKEIFSNIILSHIEIQTKLSNTKVSVMEAVMDYCEQTGLEVEVAATLFNDALKVVLEDEAKKANLLKKEKVKKKGKK